MDVVNSFHRLKLDPTVQPLNLSTTIRPDLPTSERCIQNLTAGGTHPIPPSLADILHSKIDQLRERVLLDYNTSVSQMTSISAVTKRDDIEVQLTYSRSLESWFDQAVKELFAVLTTRSKVRGPGDIPFHLTG